jgi:hypothetical protein
VMAKAPTWREDGTWVPPQSSIDLGPMETIRTCSPYFSPKRARAPASRAFSGEVMVVETV